MSLTASQTPILLIILIIISSVIGGLVLVICSTIICKYCYKLKLRRERTKSCDETLSKSQSTITVYRNRKTSRIDSVTATEVDEESITALVKKYKDTIDQDHCDLSHSTGSIKDLFKVITPTKELNVSEVFVNGEANKITMKKSLMKDSACQTFITLQDILYTQKCLTVKTQMVDDSNDINHGLNEGLVQNSKSNDMYHIVPPTDYRRNSQHLRPFDTHWGSNALSRSFDQMTDKNLSNEPRKTFSFDECESSPQTKNTVIRTNSFDNRYQTKQIEKYSPICKKQVSVTSGQSSRTSSSISTVSISQNIPNKYAAIYARVRSCSRLGKEISSVNSSFNSSSETNNCMIRSNHEINRPIILHNSTNPYRRKCNSERSPVRKVFVTRVTSKSLESREYNWHPSDNVDNNINQQQTNNKISERYLQKQNSECYPGLAKYPSSQYRQSQFMRHKSMDISKNINDRQRNKNNYCRMNSEIERNQLSIESEETFDRNAEPHLSRVGLVNISIDNSEHQFNNFQIIPDVVNSSVKEEKHYNRDSIHKSNRNPFQNLCRSNTSLETSNHLLTSAAVRRRQFSQERRRVDPNRKDSKGSLSKSVYDEYSSFMLDNLDDKKGKSMIFDRFFSSQVITSESTEPKPNKTSKHYFNTEVNENKEIKQDENRQNDIWAQQRVSSKYLRSNSQNQDSAERWNNHSIPYNEARSIAVLGNVKNTLVNRTQRNEKEFLSKSIDRTIPKIVFPENE